MQHGSHTEINGVKHDEAVLPTINSWMAAVLHWQLERGGVG